MFSPRGKQVWLLLNVKYLTFYIDCVIILLPLNHNQDAYFITVKQINNLHLQYEKQMHRGRGGGGRVGGTGVLMMIDTHTHTPRSARVLSMHASQPHPSISNVLALHACFNKIILCFHVTRKIEIEHNSLSLSCWLSNISIGVEAHLGRQSGKQHDSSASNNND